MSKFLKTRSSDQCRSHHQKYEIRFKNFAGIVNFIESKVLAENLNRSSSGNCNLSLEDACEKKSNEIFLKVENMSPEENKSLLKQ